MNPHSHYFRSKKFATSFCLQTQQNKFVNWQGDVEIRGEDFTTTVTLGNPDVLVGSGRFYSRAYVILIMSFDTNKLVNVKLNTMLSPHQVLL